MSVKRIYVVYHKQQKYMDNTIYKPILVGAYKNNIQTNILKDDYKVNISKLNTVYNELTAIYTLYKNSELLDGVEYVGLSHYRRFFIFNNRKKDKDIKSADNEKILQLTEFNEDVINDFLIDDSFIAAKSVNVGNVKKNYKKAHNAYDIDLIRKIISSKEKKYLESFDEYMSSSSAYLYNMFIFSKKDFIEYARFMFSILDEFVKVRENKEERLFISERLTGVFINSLKKEKKIVELPVLFIRGKKQSLQSAIDESRVNLQKHNQSFLYAIKPIIKWFIPTFLLKIRRFFRF